MAAAAYRAGEKIKDERTGQVHDYSGKDGVAHTEIMLPKGADKRLADRKTLWNLAEQTEKRKDAQVARSVVLALPHELTPEQRLDLTRRFVKAQFVSQGMIADIAIHRPLPEKGENPKNHHAHVLLAMRQPSGKGFRQVKTREWNKRALVEHWREQWAAYQNRDLERFGHRDRVDHRTLKEQRAEAIERGDWGRAAVLDRKPEHDIGHRAWNMLKRDQTPDPQMKTYRQAHGMTKRPIFIRSLIPASGVVWWVLGHHDPEFMAKINYQRQQQQAIEPQPPQLKGKLWWIFGKHDPAFMAKIQAEKQQRKASAMGSGSPETWVSIITKNGERKQVPYSVYMKIQHGRYEARQLQAVIADNRKRQREVAALWQRRRALFERRKSVFSRLYAEKDLGLMMGKASTAMSKAHIVKRLLEIDRYQKEIEGVLRQINGLQLRLDKRQRQLDRILDRRKREREAQEREKAARAQARALKPGQYQ